MNVLWQIYIISSNIAESLKSIDLSNTHYFLFITDFRYNVCRFLVTLVCTHTKPSDKVSRPLILVYIWKTAGRKIERWTDWRKEVMIFIKKAIGTTFEHAISFVRSVLCPYKTSGKLYYLHPWCASLLFVNYAVTISYKYLCYSSIIFLA